MNHLTAVLARRGAGVWMGTALCAALLVAFIGCNNFGGGTPTDNTSGNDNQDQSLEAIQQRSSIINLGSNIAVSGDEFISLLYTVDGTPDRIDAFYQPVADTTPNAAPIGDAVVFAPGVGAGVSQSISFRTGGLDAGNYRLGLVVTVGDRSFQLTTAGLVLLEDPPDPVFRAPLEDLEIEAGTDVSIVFDARKVPETNVQWLVFFSRFDSRDNDNDGVINGLDDCANTPSAERASVDGNGCGPSQNAADFDGDGIGNTADDCPATTANAAVDSAGCSQEQRGTQIATGSGNVGTPVWQTDNVSIGSYRIGIAATDTGKSVSGTVQDGKSNRIITRFAEAIVSIIPPPPAPKPPTLVFSIPSTDVSTFLTEIVTTTFTATINEENALGRLELFLDLDTTPNSGNETILLTDGDPSLVSWNISTEDLAEGTYNIGGTVSDGVNNPVSAYATGKLIVVKTPTLEVTAPYIGVPVSPDAEVDIEWTTNVPPSGGTVDVFYRVADANGDPVGPEVLILDDASPTTTSAVFSQDTSGIYAIFVRINFNDASVPELVRQSPQAVRVSSLPAILWLGAPAVGLRQFEGAIFEGVNFEDNAGTTLASAGDLDGDTRDEFIIGARYGKPFFTNPSGVGPGEAYMIYSSQDRLTGLFNLNSVGTSQLMGITFTGIRTRENDDTTDGLTAFTRLPDLDGDDKPELMFGFPHVASRGHNLHPEQDGVVDPSTLCTLEKANQFTRGGVVIVSSKNSIIQVPDSGAEPVIRLDEVGQAFGILQGDVFLLNLTSFEGYAPEELLGDVFGEDDQGVCQGSCLAPNPDGDGDSFTPLAASIGFNIALADNYFDAYIRNGCTGLGLDCDFEPCLSPDICTPTSPLLSRGAGMTGFYSPAGVPGEPFGARIIGIGVDDQFGTSVALNNQLSTGDGDIIVSAPNRTARGILCCENEVGTEFGPEISGMEASVTSDSGVAYLFDLRNLWETDEFGRIPPRPHQYMVGQPSHCDSTITRIPNIGADQPDQTCIRIAGLADDNIRNIIGLEDFNRDGRNDFAVGAPEANEGLGRVYVAFRRERSLEDDYVLEKLSLAPSDPERLAGVEIIASSQDAFGASLATGVDFNGDGRGDLIVGSPDADGGVGEVVIIFADPNLVSPEGGITIETLLATGRAAKITGNPLDTGGNFGFNVANAGDVNGDQVNDLLIAAPNATPRFDPTPTDASDDLTAPGLDLDFDGLADDIANDFDLPGFDNGMTEAGLVYVIFGASNGRNRLDNLGGDNTVSVTDLGSAVLRGYMIAGRRAGDHLGGGDAGDEAMGGIGGKEGRGRSIGLASAGDVDGDGNAEILIGAILADPRRDRTTGVGLQNGGEAYLIYGGAVP